MLKSEFVEVKLTSNNIKYYENRGYVFEKHIGRDKKFHVDKNLKIVVSVSDLPEFSNIEIEYNCDGCGKLLKMPYSRYSMNNKNNRKTFCYPCGKGLVSLGQFFIENGSDIYKIWGNKNTENPFEISHGSKKKYWCKCLRTDYHEEYLMSPNNICKHINSETGCPYCVSQRGMVHSRDSLAGKYPESIKAWSEKNIKNPYCVTPMTNNKYWFKCENNKHEDFCRCVSSSVKFEFRCPMCVQERSESFLQEKVRLYLESLNYEIFHEGSCTLKPRNPLTNNVLYYDNQIESLKLIIEVHGGQHYDGVKFYKTKCKISEEDAIKKFEDLKIRDAYKKQYALDNNYFFLEIPYWSDNAKTDWKILIDNKIKEILEQKDG